MSVRHEIVEALDTVAGLFATPQAPDIVTEGCAWPVWRLLERPPGCTYVTEWDVFVALTGANLETAIDEAEDGAGIVVRVIDALEELGPTTPVEPVDLALPSGSMQPALRYRVRIER
jgi:hypothetical protein